MPPNKITLNSIVDYALIFLFLTILMIPFNLYNIKIGSFLFHHIYITVFVSILVVLSLLKKPRLDLFDKWLLLLTEGFALSFITSVDRSHTLSVLSGFFLKGVCIAFLANRIHKDRINTITAIMIFGATIFSLAGIIEVFFDWHLLPKPAELSDYFLYASVGNPLPFAACLVLFIPVSLWYLKSKKNIIAAIPFLSIIIGIITSFSRSGWLAVFCALAIYLLKNKLPKVNAKNVIYPLFVVLSISLTLFIMPDRAKTRIADKFNAQMFSSGSFNHRIRSFITVKNIVKDYPLFGVGFGNYPMVHEKYKAEGTYKHTPTPDNMYLRLISDTGIAGTAIFFTFIIYWLVKIWGRRNDPLAWAIFCGLIGFLINMLAADLLFWTIPQFTFWMLFGLGVNIINGKNNA